MAILGAIWSQEARLYSGALFFGLGLLTGSSDRAAQTRLRIVHPRSQHRSISCANVKHYRGRMLGQKIVSESG
jgi:hypothetical protein